MINQKHLKTLHQTYMSIYEPLGFGEKQFKTFTEKLILAKKLRHDTLKQRDLKDHNWFQSHVVIGMTLYIDLFANNISGLIDRIPYLLELGITLIHLMPILKPRDGNNDGGYAVVDYKDINPKLGTLNDFKRLVQAFHEVGIRVAIDFVINHTAKEHPWALKASSGDAFYQAMFMMYDTNDIPNQFNKTVPEVLPNEYPGNFTYYESFDKYVFTSFSEFQWDLNFKNPVVLEEIIDIFFFLANLGVDVIRLDAIPFIWKELGTHCRNLPKVHDFMHLFYLARDYVCPSVAILGEAIVEPHEIIKYYGSNQTPECQLLYNANLMVNLWHTLATRDTRLLNIDQQRFDLPNHGTWINYVRCHDDIGWGFNEEANQTLGFSPYQHKQFLINFYNGSFEGSFARGQNYQFNPKNKDARTNGTLASLAGLEKAIQEKDSIGIKTAIKRIQLLHAYIFSSPGFPLIYSGDEIAQLNHYDYNLIEKTTDGRWLHRMKFPWDSAHKWKNTETPSGKIFKYIQSIIQIRKNERLFNSQIKQHLIETQNTHVTVSLKHDGDDVILFVYNFSEHQQIIHLNMLNTILKGTYINLIDHTKYSIDDNPLILQPYDTLWLKNKTMS